jgi:hypothetical protein
MNVRKWLTRNSVQATLGVLAFFARRPALSGVTRFLTRALARITVRARRIGVAAGPEELGPLWQRSFPSKKQVPIERVEGRTVYAQIHTPCPLRGSGDVHACHRMMEYDREVLRRAGGQFVVLESQATPGRTFCRVAMRLEGESVADLPQAHERTRP